MNDLGIALCGVVVGAALAGITTVLVDRARIRREQATSTYADFCSHLSGLAFASGKKAKRTAQSNLAATMARIAVYGSKDVVERLADFLRAGGELGTDDPKYVEVVEAMRKHAAKVGRAANKQAIRAVLADAVKTQDSND